ncbi:MAG: restriction endonuclease [Planctomycetia bacterium]|nr:restriction endonuclease [Planctomycetia bacterium]
MAIHFSCPICQSTLLLPDGCGGQTAKCPSCLADFVIPGSSETDSSAPVCAVLAPRADKITETDVQRAQLEVKQLAAEDLALHIRLTEMNRRLRRQAVRLSTLQSFQSGRQILDHTMGRAGGFCLAVTAGGAAPVLLASFFSPSAFAYFVVASLGMIGAGIVYLPYSFVPADGRLAPIVAELATKVKGANILYEQVAAEGAALAAKLSAAEAEYSRLKGVFESRLGWLRTCQWQVMTGGPFENFLAQIFEEHGYIVEKIGRSGDQGVDLIVARGGSRVAIQAKGYVGTTVGNEAVQQVHAGMSFHGCNAAAVVTNSRYTPSARALAQRIGCQLIDGSQIPDLIEGRILV